MQKIILVFRCRNEAFDSLYIWIRSFIFNISIHFYCLGTFMKNYSRKWITQRLTATLLLPLTFWFIYSAISLSEMEYDDIMIFFKSYINLLLFYIMMIVMLLHSKLGLQTIIDDYVTSKKGSKTIKFIINLFSYSLMCLITILIFRNLF